MTSFTEEFHHQLQCAATRLSAAVAANDPFLIEIARARISELGEIARRHCGLEVAPSEGLGSQPLHSRRSWALQPVA
jgi:hypothetical protein